MLVLIQIKKLLVILKALQYIKPEKNKPPF